MAASNQISPGVAWTEKDITQIVPGISTSTGAYAGAFQWGPVGQISTVVSEDDLAARFGHPDDNVYRHFFVCASFFAYSNHIELLRIAGPNARNASSGGLGTGLELDIVAQNTEVLSVSITSGHAGSGYIAGDLVQLVGAVDDALVRVLTVSNTGAVLTVQLLTTGVGFQSAGGQPTTIVNNVRVDNDDELATELYLPEVIAAYPGARANGLIFSSARASEFDEWEYNNRFAIAPSANVNTWSGDGATLSFALQNGMTVLPSDAVVTVDGFPRVPGSSPGEYGVSSGHIVFVEDIESFTTTLDQTSWTLANTYNLDTSQAIVKLNGTVVPRYIGTASIPTIGTSMVVGNTVTYGTGRTTFSGDANTLVFTILGVTGINDGVVVADGVQKTVVYTGVPAAGHVVLATSGGNTTITFAIGEAPKAGISNVVATWAYPATSSTVEVDYGHPKAGINNVKLFWNQTQIHAVVVDSTGIWSSGIAFSLLERYQFLSLVPGTKNFDGTAAYYQTAINRQSQYVRIPGTISVHQSKLLSGGVDANVMGTDITIGMVQSAYDMYNNRDKVDVSHIISTSEDSAAVLYGIQDLAEERKDVVFYFSPPQDAVVQNTNNEATDVTAFRNLLTSSSYATMDSNWKYMYDRYNDVYRWVPCCGDVAGIYAFTHDAYDPWWSGGGLNRGLIKNAVKLAWVPGQVDRDILYANGVNPITQFKNTGPVLYGDKTLQTMPSAFDRMNVRWLFIVLEVTISQLARYFLFEFNDVYTQNQFVNAVHPFLVQVQGRRGVSDFKIVADGTVNTPEVIDSNDFRASILIKPARSINFIDLTFWAVPTGLNFSSVPVI